MTEDAFTTAPDQAVADVAGKTPRGCFGSAVVMQVSILMGIFTDGHLHGSRLWIVEWNTVIGIVSPARHSKHRVRRSGR
jgi:hypothetical protein